MHIFRKFNLDNFVYQKNRFDVSATAIFWMSAGAVEDVSDSALSKSSANSGGAMDSRMGMSSRRFMGVCNTAVYL